MSGSRAMQFNGYLSPSTGAPLAESEGQLVSLDGSETFAIRNGVPQLRSSPLPESEHEYDEEMRGICERSKEIGWRDALKSVRGEWDYVTDPSRLKVLDIVPIAPTDRVLEIGPALGQMTTSLADRAQEVVALEIRPGQAEFALQRCREEGHENVAIACGGDRCVLPLADASFSVAVVNLVFEWCAREMTSDPFEAGQDKFLAELARVLKPGGYLYLSTKNRFALRLLRGKRDEHMYDMRFGNALPRWLGRFMMNRKGKTRIGGLLHSFPALRRKIAAAGFTTITPYWLCPEMRKPQWIAECTAEGVRHVRSQPGVEQGQYRSTAMLMRLVPAPFVKYVTPGLTFVARKGDS